jgi:Cof subfamily protein (haloacid dehalogenase superfamily)
MTMNNIKLVATDLDGTFLRNDKSISQLNLDALCFLGRNNIVRVVATGRNLKKVNEVIPEEVPFDFVVYSSGAGVYDHQRKKHIYTRNISEESANRLIRFFISADVSFHAFRPAPENHDLWFHRGSEACPEFERYFAYHKSSALPLPESGMIKSGLCQFLVVIPANEAMFIDMKTRIEALCPEIRVIRSSSPLNTGYIWLEVFHRDVSKGNGVLQVCNILNINPKNTLGIGNDYNDIDLLEFTEHSFLTDNAPENLKKGFTVLPTNEEDAFAHIVSRINLR